MFALYHELTDSLLTARHYMTYDAFEYNYQLFKKTNRDRIPDLNLTIPTRYTVSYSTCMPIEVSAEHAIVQ